MIWINLQLPYTSTHVIKQSSKQFLHLLLVLKKKDYSVNLGASTTKEMIFHILLSTLFFVY
jgi:hypothetical protein